MANNTRNFLPLKDGWVMKQLPFKASTAIEEGTAIGIEISGNTTTGNLTKMGVENASGADFVGILAEEIASTDSDYATAGKLKSVWVPMSPYTSFAKAPVGAGTLTAADRYKTVEFHSDSKSVAVDTPGKGVRIQEVSTADNTVIVSFPFGATETA